MSVWLGGMLFSRPDRRALLLLLLLVLVTRMSKDTPVQRGSVTCVSKTCVTRLRIVGEGVAMVSNAIPMPLPPHAYHCLLLLRSAAAECSVCRMMGL